LSSSARKSELQFLTVIREQPAKWSQKHCQSSTAKRPPVEKKGKIGQEASQATLALPIAKNEPSYETTRKVQKQEFRRHNEKVSARLPNNARQARLAPYVQEENEQKNMLKSLPESQDRQVAKTSGRKTAGY